MFTMPCRVLLTSALTFLLLAAVSSATSRADDDKLDRSEAKAEKKHDPRPDHKDRKRDKQAARIELALLLDTSNSMDGLIHQAKAQLWKIVNELSSCRKRGHSPDLRVALYEYGNSGLPDDGGWVRQVLPLTDNLDDVSEKLFALKTNGGDEYCGRVIQAATDGLDWSDDEEDLKIIVIAGNEPFTQGNVDYKKACRAAVKKGIIVNTIFCGEKGEGIETKWQDGAERGKGKYSFIDQDKKRIEIATPYDEELRTLSEKINNTYLFHGEGRARYRSNQMRQDRNAASLGVDAAVGRAITKGGSNYSFDADLAARPTAAAETLEKAKAEDLPEELRGRSREEQIKIVEEKATERKQIQDQIRDLSGKRDRYLAEQRTQQNEGEVGQSLDEALLGALREQARERGFSVEK